jgi:opine dehydrogenase
VPELGDNLSGAKEKGGIDLKVTGKPGLTPGFARLNKVTTDAKEALEDADVVLAVVPSFAQRRFAEFCAPYLRSDQLVVLSPGNFGGCLEFWRVLRENGSEAKPLLCETECMTYSGFKSGPAEVEVSGYKHGHTMAAFPGNRTPEALERLRTLFPTVKGAVNILETGLRNVNTVMHAPITVLNAGRIEETEGKFLFYWQGVTEGVGAAVERVEAERLQIGEALGIVLTPTRDVLLEYYSHSGASGDTLPEVMRTNPVYEIDWAPPRLQHRFITEDIPYGMVPMERMGELTGVPTPVTTSVIELASALLREDLRQQARDLDSLGLGGLSIEELKRFFDEGPQEG